MFDESSWWSLENLLRDEEGLYARTAGEAIFDVDDQMIVILGLLNQADHEPDRRDDLESAAVDLWRRVAAFDEEGGFYYLVVASPSVCIDLETNGWALLAAAELEARDLDAGGDVRDRGTAVASTLAEGMTQNRSAGIDVCARDVIRDALPLLGLAAWDSATSSTSRLQAIRARVADVVDARWDRVFYDASDIYDVVRNSQWLVTLLAIQRIYGISEFEDRVAALTDYLTNHAVRQSSSGYELLFRQRGTDALLDAAVSPDGFLWLSYALHQDRLAMPTPEAESPLISGLMEALLSTAWDPRTGSVGQPGSAAQTAPNALAVAMGTSPRPKDLQRELSDVSVVVAGDAHRVYPAADAPGADRYLITNEASYSFIVDLPASDTVLFYPATLVGDYHFNFPGSSFYPEPAAIRVPSGSAVSVEANGMDAASFLRFDTTGAPGSVQFLLRGYVPIDPVDYAYGQAIDVRVDNRLPRTLIVPRLSLEIEATDVSWRHVALNGITFSQFQTTSVGANSFIPRTHTRMVLNNLPLAPGPNTIRLSYEDVSPPQIKAFDLYADAQLREPLPRPAPGQPYEALTGQEVFAVVQASDNARVAAVSLDVRPSGQDASTVEMQRSDSGSGQWVGSVRIGSTGQATLTAFAEDASGFLSEPAGERVDVRSSFFAGASVLLFVFAAGLFVATAFIYLKVRRRKGR